MKRFVYFSISILCLSIAALIGFYIGSELAQAQAPEPISGYRVTESYSTTHHFVMLSNGDVYYRRYELGPAFDPLKYVGNFWDGAVPTSPETWGKIKGLYERSK